jgi:hypothetical protein
VHAYICTCIHTSDNNHIHEVSKLKSLLYYEKSALVSKVCSTLRLYYLSQSLYVSFEMESADVLRMMLEFLTRERE